MRRAESRQTVRRSGVCQSVVFWLPVAHHVTGHGWNSGDFGDQVDRLRGPQGVDEDEFGAGRIRIRLRFGEDLESVQQGHLGDRLAGAAAGPRGDKRKSLSKTLAVSAHSCLRCYP